MFDRARNTNWAVMAVAIPSAPTRINLEFSADGRLPVFNAAAAFSSQDENNVADVYLYDFKNNDLRLVSHALGSDAAGNASSDSSVLSPDGRARNFAGGRLHWRSAANASSQLRL